MLDGGLTILGYHVLRGGGEGPLEVVAELGALTGFVDEDVVNGQTYRYAVAAYNALGLGAVTETVQATPSADRKCRVVSCPGLPKTLGPLSKNVMTVPTFCQLFQVSASNCTIPTFGKLAPRWYLLQTVTSPFKQVRKAGVEAVR